MYPLVFSFNRTRLYSLKLSMFISSKQTTFWSKFLPKEYLQSKLSLIFALLFYFSVDLFGFLSLIRIYTFSSLTPLVIATSSVLALITVHPRS